MSFEVVASKNDMATSMHVDIHVVGSLVQCPCIQVILQVVHSLRTLEMCL